MSIGALYPIIKPSLLLDFAKTKQLDPRITFTRASTATYYDGETSALAEQNLVLQSQTLDNASWTKLGVSVATDSTTAPDGTTTAETVTTTAGAGTDNISQTIAIASGVSYTYSVYAKYLATQWLRIRMITGVTGNPSTWFDVQNGVVGTVESGMTASIVSVGNGWYRCIVSFTTAAASNIPTMYFSTTNGGSPSSIGLNMYLWGAQLEQRSAVTAYTPTTTAAITNYIPVLLTAQAGQARFDHNPTTGDSLGLLIEEQRTNLVTYSEQFDNAAWATSALTISANNIVSPDGTQDAEALIETTTPSAFHFSQQTITKAASVIQYTFSVYVKAKGRQLGISVASGAGGAVCRFNPDTGLFTLTAAAYGTWTAQSSTATLVGNGWYRVVLVGTSDTATSVTIQISTYNTALATNVYTGDGVSGFYLWGAQLEAGAFATSYIPTVASQITRSADNASMTGTNFSSWFRQDEGTLYAESSTTDTANFPTAASIYLDNNNFISLDTRAATVRALIFTNGTGILVRTSTKLSSNKIAICYKNGSSNVSFNGIAASTDITANTPKGISILYIGSFSGSATNYQNGTIKKIAYYPKRVTNTELQGLTS